MRSCQRQPRPSRISDNFTVEIYICSSYWTICRYRSSARNTCNVQLQSRYRTDNGIGKISEPVPNRYREGRSPFESAMCYFARLIRFVPMRYELRSCVFVVTSLYMRTWHEMQQQIKAREKYIFEEGSSEIANMLYVNVKLLECGWKS